MIIARVDGHFYVADHVDFDDFENIVCAANIAGYLESEQKIYVESDTQLTKFILIKFEDWLNEESERISFQDYMTDQLINEFEFKED